MCQQQYRSLRGSSLASKYVQPAERWNGSKKNIRPKKAPTPRGRIKLLTFQGTSPDGMSKLFREERNLIQFMAHPGLQSMQSLTKCDEPRSERLQRTALVTLLIVCLTVLSSRVETDLAALKK